MPKEQDVDAKAVSTTKSRDPLQTKYFCEVTQKKIVDVVMEISAIETSIQRRLPLRYVLVIDVSGSMDGRVGNGIESLLDRVKIFAELVIQNVANEDSVAIVTFSHDVELNMPMTTMTKKARAEANDIVNALRTRGLTNLEIGLLMALEELKKNPSENARDLIIVFTDGMANEGETNAENLARKYKDAQSQIRNSFCIPLAALTIGQYAPILLDQIAGQLGSEAFYWLNENEEFEADMLIPVFLREETIVTDVRIDMKCLEDVTFSPSHVSQKHLQESTNETLSYLIHAMPMTIKKHIPFALVLPQQKLEELDKKRILDIQVTYMDEKLEERKVEDFIELRTTPLSTLNPTVRIDKSGIMDEVSAFSIADNQVSITWQSAQISLVEVAGEKYRRLSLVAINNAMYYISMDDRKGHVATVKGAILEINAVRKRYTTMLGERSKYVKMVSDAAENWVAKLNFGKILSSKVDIGRLLAMQSSIATEMPVAKGVFDPKIKRPYLPPKIENKLKRYEKVVEKTKKKKQTPQTSRVFKAQNVLVSESLREKQVPVGSGVRRETLTELIIRCGGTPVPNVNTVFNDTFLVCSNRDFKRNTVLVRDAKRAKIPIVQEQFIYDCIRQNKILDLDKYILKAGSTEASAN